MKALSHMKIHSVNSVWSGAAAVSTRTSSDRRLEHQTDRTRINLKWTLTFYFAPCPVCWHGGGAYDLLCNQPPEGSRDVWSRTHLQQANRCCDVTTQSCCCTWNAKTPPASTQHQRFIPENPVNRNHNDGDMNESKQHHLVVRCTVRKQVKSRSHGLSTSVQKKMSVLKIRFRLLLVQ